jgi:hypothetical protein
MVKIIKKIFKAIKAFFWYLINGCLPIGKSARELRIYDFIKTNTGKAIDFDGHFGAQCVDLVRLFWRDVEKIPQPEPTGTDGAISFFDNHYFRPIQKKHLKRVSFEKGMIPPAGAVVVFAPIPTNRFGHIGICVEANSEGISLFEQNGTANTRALAEGREQAGAFIGNWNYDRVRGWLLLA